MNNRQEFLRKLLERDKQIIAQGVRQDRPYPIEWEQDRKGPAAADSPGDDQDEPATPASSESTSSHALSEIPADRQPVPGVPDAQEVSEDLAGPNQPLSPTDPHQSPPAPDAHAALHSDELPSLDSLDRSPIPGIPDVDEIRRDAPQGASADLPAGFASQGYAAPRVGTSGGGQAGAPGAHAQQRLPVRGDLSEPAMDHTYNHTEPDYRQAFSDILTPELERMHASMQMQLMEAVTQVRFDMERRHLI